jgi:hypothetical protein
MGNGIQKKLVHPKFYTEAELDYLRLYYPTVHNADIAMILNRPIFSIGAKANELGLKKCKEFLKMNMRRVSEIGRIKCPVRSSHFKVGNKTWNSGMKMSREYIDKIRNTCYKKGNMPYNYKMIGDTRDYNGYKEIKVDHSKWISFARHTWMQAHGEIPQGYVVFRIDGNCRNDNLENLCLVKRSDLAVQNRWLKSVPEEYREVQKLIHQIKKITNEKQNKRPSQPSL